MKRFSGMRLPVAVLAAAALCACAAPPEITEMVVKDGDARLQPPLARGRYEYLLAPVQGDTLVIDSITVPEGSALAVDGRAAVPGTPVRLENLRPGPNRIPFTVTAANGTETAYEITAYGALSVRRDDPKNRFVDRGDGTIADTATGLVWFRDGTASGMVTWKDAFDFIERLDGDWRMPNILEMRSLVFRAAEDKTGTLERYGFRNMQGLYWTSTTYRLNRSRAWTALFTDTHTPLAREKSGYCRVLPVSSVSGLPKSGADVPSGYEPHANEDGATRYGIDWPDPRFRVNGDGTITDNMTGLVWMKNGEEAGELRNYGDAAAFVAGLNAGKASPEGWRMPVMAELDTLLHFGKENGLAWLTENGFANLGQLVWSDTPYPDAGAGLLMWGMTLMNGLDTGLTKDLRSVGVLPVKGGFRAEPPSSLENALTFPDPGL